MRGICDIVHKNLTLTPTTTEDLAKRCGLSAQQVVGAMYHLRHLGKGCSCKKKGKREYRHYLNQSDHKQGQIGLIVYGKEREFAPGHQKGNATDRSSPSKPVTTNKIPAMMKQGFLLLQPKIKPHLSTYSSDVSPLEKIKRGLELVAEGSKELGTDLPYLIDLGHKVHNTVQNHQEVES